MPVLLFLLLVALSAIVGWCGRKRTIGFAGFFVLSLLVTPFVMALVLLVSAPREPLVSGTSLADQSDKNA